MSEEASAPLPAVPYLKLPEGGDPFLEGQKCGKCGSIFLGERKVCSKCGTRGGFSAVKLADTGRLHVFSIVHRSFPGIEVPYVSAIVDLDGGGTGEGEPDRHRPGSGEDPVRDAGEGGLQGRPRPQGQRGQFLHLVLLPAVPGLSQGDPHV